MSKTIKARESEESGDVQRLMEGKTNNCHLTGKSISNDKVVEICHTTMCVQFKTRYCAMQR